MKKVSKIMKWTQLPRISVVLVIFLGLYQSVKAQQPQGKVVFEDNFDDGKSLDDLDYTATAVQGAPEKPAISANKSASGKNSIYFPGKRTYIRKRFDRNGLSNIIFEWKANIPELGGSFGINLYNGRVAVVKTNLFSKNFVYFNEANEKITLAPYNANEWITFRIEITGNKYNVYMNNKLVGENIPTLGGQTAVNSIYYSVGNKTAYVDDIRISTKGE